MIVWFEKHTKPRAHSEVVARVLWANETRGCVVPQENDIRPVSCHSDYSYCYPEHLLTHQTMSNTDISSSTATTSNTNIAGVFEIHITVEPSSQARLRALIDTTLRLDKKYSWMIRPRLTQAISLFGDHPLQPMFACFFNSTEDVAMTELMNLRTLMIERGIVPVRTKLEASASSLGVPIRCEGDHYFEFHFDVPLDDSNPAGDWNDLVDILTPFGCQVSFNLNKPEIMPIATIRHYGTLTEISDQFKQIKSVLEKHDYECIKQQREYSVYDDNVMLDAGWMFDTDPRVPKTIVTPQMKF